MGPFTHTIAQTYCPTPKDQRFDAGIFGKQASYFHGKTTQKRIHEASTDDGALNSPVFHP